MTRGLFICLLLMPAPVWGASGSVDFFASGVKLFVGMAIVIGIMLLIHAVNRKGFKFLESRQSRQIRIVENRPMGGRKSLCLVEVDGERLLLGVGNDRLDLLHHFQAGSAAGRFEEELRAFDGADK